MRKMSLKKKLLFLASTGPIAIVALFALRWQPSQTIGTVAGDTVSNAQAKNSPIVFGPNIPDNLPSTANDPATDPTNTSAPSPAAAISQPAAKPAIKTVAKTTTTTTKTSSPIQTSSPAPAPAPAQSCGGAFASQFICLLNQYRASKGLGKVSWNSGLAGVAQKHSDWMNSTGIFSHEETDGSHLTQRCAAAGITCRAENLAEGFQSAQNLLNMWIASPDHNANLLGPYTTAGLGVSGKYVTLLLN